MDIISRVLLICDDGPVSLTIRQRLVIGGDYSVVFEPTAKGALNALKQNNFDVVVLKFGLPGLDAGHFIAELKKVDPDCVVIVFTEEGDLDAFKDLSSLKIYDFLVKPINYDKLLFLIKKGSELHSLTAASRKFAQGLHEQNTSLHKQNTLLAKRIEESTKNLSRLYEDLRSTYMRTIKVLAQAIDARDHYTHSHSQNVSRYAVAIAEELGLAVREIQIIREACELHDLGKIGIGDEILGKASSLTTEEWVKIKQHPQVAAQILEPLTFLSEVIEMVRQHHERYDGAGYPEGRKAEDIILGARIINLADSYDAMRSARAYRKTPLTKEEAVHEVKKNSGTQFDPEIVKAFLRVVGKVDPY